MSVVKGSSGTINTPLEQQPNQALTGQTSVGCRSMLIDPQWIHWRSSSNFELQVVQFAKRNSKNWNAQASELAEVALRTGLRQSRVLASPSAGMLIAQPIGTYGNECVTVWFSCSLSDITESATAECFLATEKFADFLSSTTTRTAQPEPLEILPQPNKAASSTQDQAACATIAIESQSADESQRSKNTEHLPTWLELANLFKLKLLKSCVISKSNTKSYAIATLILSAVCVLPWPHRVACNAVCEPVVRRYVAAPFDGRLLRSHVVVGQQVRQGELLATLDGGELRSQIAGVRAKLAQAEQRELAALAGGDHSKAGLERLEVEHLCRELEVLETRQSSLEIRSPIDGVVVTGDLERAEGAQLSLGESLFEIASLDKLIAEVCIPESDVTFVDRGMHVSILLEAMPDTRIDAKIEKLHLRSEVRDNQSVFIAEAELSNEAKLIRPGMSAKAWVASGYRSLGWQLFHRPYNAARQYLGW